MTQIHAIASAAVFWEENGALTKDRQEKVSLRCNKKGIGHIY